MIYIYNQAQINTSLNAYVLYNEKNKTSISTLMTSEDVSILNDLIPCKEIETRPKGYNLLPRGMHDDFFKEL